MLTIALDIDNVMAEITTPWLVWHNQHWHEHPMCVDDWTDWDIDQYTPAGKKIYKFLEDFTYDWVLPVIGARQGLVNLLDTDSRIVYVTTSPLSVMGVKYKWLERWHFISSLDDYIECHDKSLVNADVLIDDNFHNVKQFDGLGILFDQPWNAKYEYPFRMMGWRDTRYLEWIINLNQCLAKGTI